LVLSARSYASFKARAQCAADFYLGWGVPAACAGRATDQSIGESRWLTHADIRVAIGAPLNLSLGGQVRCEGKLVGIPTLSIDGDDEVNVFATRGSTRIEPGSNPDTRFGGYECRHGVNGGAARRDRRGLPQRQRFIGSISEQKYMF
jgi:hypothetical protein